MRPASLTPLRVAIALAALAPAVISGCAACAPSGAVLWPHPEGSWAGLATADVPLGQPVTLGAIVLCVEGAETGEVLAVRPLDGSGIDITAFTLRPQDEWEMYGGDRVSLTQTGIETGVTRVAAPCGGDLGTELIVEVRRTSGEAASTSGLVIDYQVGNRSGSTQIDYGVMLCAPGVEPCEFIR